MGNVKSWLECVRESVSIWALAAFLVYGVASLLVGEVFPFSQYRMYAISEYPRGTALVFLADGEPIPRIDDFVAIDGISPEQLVYPDSIQSSQEYLLDSVRHAVTVRSSALPPSSPSVRLQIGYSIAESTPDGFRILSPFEPLAEGRAWLTD